MTDKTALEKPGAFSLVLNFLPLAHLVSGGMVTFAGFDTAGQRLTCLLTWVYLLPPLAARLSLLAYVGPGVVITDRYLVQVEKGAVLGLKSTLAGHMVIRDAQGRYLVVVAAPTVEAESIVGGYAGLGPGATLRAGELLPTGRRIAPFNAWPRCSIKENAS